MGKVCERCGEEIGATRDGDNVCAKCDGLKRGKLLASVAKRQRLDREEAMRSCGLVKVKGAMGGTYWE